jgi:hypothetical protein
MALRSVRRFIGINNVKSGMLVQFGYSKLDNSSNSYTALVIDPNKNNYMHALLIDKLSDAELVSLVTQLGSLNYDPEAKNAPITDLQNDEAYKNYTQIKDKRLYRTFRLNKISNLRQILIGELK